MSSSTSSMAAFRLSTQQERAWLEHERGAGQFAQGVIGIEGPLDVARLKAALQQAVSKYEILRTVLRRQTAVKLPFQVIQEDAAFRFEQAAGGDVAELAAGERASLLGNESGPSLRGLLIASAAGRHSLVLTLPVFCADHETLKTLVGEIAAGYGGESGAAGDDAMQYADLVEWQNELLASEETKAGRDFWRSSCRAIDFAALGSLALPLEKPIAQKDEPAFGSVAMTLAGMSAAVAALASRTKTSEEAVLLAAWSALLARLTGNSAVTVASEFNGRRYEELQSALGPLARSLPIGLEVAPEVRFSELIAKVGAVTAEARNWQESFA